MADNNYTISRADIHNADGKLVGAFQTATFACSSALAFSPVTGLSSFDITDISVIGANSNFSIVAEAPLPLKIINGRKSSVSFDVVFANNTASETTLSFPVSVAITGGNASLSAGSEGTVFGTATVNSIIFTVSAANGWRGEPGGRVWSTHAEHMRARNMGYI